MHGKLTEPPFDVLLFSNPGEKFEKEGKLWDRFFPTVFLHFMTFSPRLETLIALHCSSDSFPHIVMYILCVENCQNFILTHSSLPIDCSIMWKKCIYPGSESATYKCYDHRKINKYFVLYLCKELPIQERKDNLTETYPCKWGVQVVGKWISAVY